ncbi:MAG: hypothetical protein ACXVZV_01515 [Terriglobales bacterium]
MRKRSKIRLVIGIAIRVVLLTVIFTLLAFAIGLFCGIGASLLYGAIRHIQPDMSWAYKFVAAPFGVIGLVVSFFLMLINEIRRARRPLEFSRPTSFERTF